jgi:CHAD domain-containing protein
MPEDMEELRTYADAGPAVSRATCGRAADEIERLRSEIEELGRDANAEVASLEAQIEELRDQLGDERDRW